MWGSCFACCIPSKREIGLKPILLPPTPNNPRTPMSPLSERTLVSRFDVKDKWQTPINVITPDHSVTPLTENYQKYENSMLEDKSPPVMQEKSPLI